MEDYEQELCGVEDDFHNQFAAELEGRRLRRPPGSPCPPRADPRGRSRRPLPEGTRPPVPPQPHLWAAARAAPGRGRWTPTCSRPGPCPTPPGSNGLGCRWSRG
ncbi:CHTF18 isoform 19 [Pan troglodytes]|uniref:CHTF18 isoform 19 n=1 Tax=Pan troglodytes TaxID=9598 RepID=A0A2J8J862_PANTR|nr:CHTF18 isoform 19 [Pan troglodytes]